MGEGEWGGLPITDSNPPAQQKCVLPLLMKWTRIEAILETNELIQNWMLDINPKKIL